MNTNTVNDLIEVDSSGQHFEGYALLKESQDGKTAKGDPYFNLKIGKQGKTVPCKLWDRGFGNHDVASLKQLFKTGAILYLKGIVGEYRGELQLTIDSFRLANDEEYVLEDFLESAPEPIVDLTKEYEEFIDSIERPMLKEIVLGLYKDHQNTFTSYPAATNNHHTFVGGLLYHTVSMLRIGDNICKQYPQVRRDYVISAIALHDLGKVIELSSSVAPEYTTIGSLLGHITIVNMLIDRKVQILRQDKEKYSASDVQSAIELMHCVSAHHGKKEWGSPVESMTLEAEIIHHIDMIDSRINMITYGLQDKQEGEFHKIYPMGKFYKSVQ